MQRAFSSTVYILLFTVYCFLFSSFSRAQSKAGVSFLNENDLNYLSGLTESVMESSRIYPGQKIVDFFGPNNTGGVLIRPGGRDCYPSFWIRDYAMSLESGFVKPDEQKHMLLLTAETQCNQTWITKGGSMVPYGAIADHIRIDDALPIYYPGTYSFEEQGIARFGKTPPYSDQFFFIHMAWYYVNSTGDNHILSRDINGLSLMDRLELAFKILPSGDEHLVYTTDDFRGVDFGFRDVQEITGYLCFPSVLKYRAANEMAHFYQILAQPGKASQYQEIAAVIKEAIPLVFMDSRGMLRASTGKSRQADVWSTALAVYLKAMNPEPTKRSCEMLAKAYKDGSLAYKGNIRHILTTDDYSETTAWEFSEAKKNTYQNGAYWGTPTGWVCYAIAQVDVTLAQQLAKEYVDDLRTTDYRKGADFGGPYECFHSDGDYSANPVYLTTVACPFAVFKQQN